jgi:hypothetical protein
LACGFILHSPRLRKRTEGGGGLGKRRRSKMGRGGIALVGLKNLSNVNVDVHGFKESS